jgi:hypothetical protein
VTARIDQTKIQNRNTHPMKNWLRLGLLCGLLTACAAPKTGAQSAGASGASEDDEEGMICHEQSNTGSSITRRVCRPRPKDDDDEADRKRDETRRDLTRRPASPTAGGQ